MKQIIANTMNIYQQQLSMIIDTFKRGIKQKRWLTAIVKHIVETHTLHWKQLTNSLDM